jgi:cytochrome c oxidase subunit 2
MFFKGFWGYANALVVPAEGLTVTVVGKQWAWNATYPNGAVSSESTRSRDLARIDSADGVQDSPIFYVPEETPVHFRLSSEDVLHSFWVLDMRAKFDVYPNRYTGVWFKSDPIKGDSVLTDKNGKPILGADGKPVRYKDHWVFCAEYCGSNHSEMLAVIRVVPKDYFEDWVKKAATPTGTDAERGEKYFKIKGCNSCHSTDGTRAVGPTWKNLYGYPVTFKDGSGMTAAERTGTSFANYVRKSVFDPGFQIVEGYSNQMQNFTGRLNEDELRCLIAYLSSPKLTDKAAPQGAETPAESAPEKK